MQFVYIHVSLCCSEPVDEVFFKERRAGHAWRPVALRVAPEVLVWRAAHCELKGYCGPPPSPDHPETCQTLKRCEFYEVLFRIAG